MLKHYSRAEDGKVIFPARQNAYYRRMPERPFPYRGMRASTAHAPLRVAAKRTAVAAIVWFALGGALHAGGGPENVILIVNQRSWASLTIANHFIAWRKLPPNNVIYLDWSGPIDEIDLPTFLDQIVKPVFATIQERRLTDHIDYIVYSSDFPWTVDARKQMAKLNLPDALNPVGALTGMTYFGAAIMNRDATFVAVNSNHYVRPTQPKPGVPSTHGFRSWYGWGSDGALLEAGGAHYALSTMLAVTSGRGNSVSEALTYLDRAAKADGTRPNGTIYYVLNDDVRSKTRRGEVAPAIEQLKALGVRAEVLQGKIPINCKDVMGAMLGIEEFDWGESGSLIRPGAICENLTSFGGDLKLGAKQTPLTELLRYGAAGSSGAVIEPYSMQAKFPLPQIHVHYARGCSMAESYYQSVASPFQLLVVGDPLCQPWAVAPKVTIEGGPSQQPVRGAFELLPKVEGTREAIDQFDWYVDGKRAATTRTGDRVRFDTAQFVDGYHIITAVVSNPDAIETQGRASIELVTGNHGGQCTLARQNADPVRWGIPLEMTFNAPGATACALVQGSRVLGRVDKAQSAISINPILLGYGPVELQMLALGLPGGQVASTPVRVSIQPNEPLPSVPLTPGNRLWPGFIVTPEGKPPKTVVFVPNAFWLGDAGVMAGGKFQVEGWIDVPADDVYQFHLRHYGALRLEVDQVPLYEETAGDYALRMAPVALAKGTHRVKLSGAAGDRLNMDFGFGGPGIRHMSGTLLQHEAK